MHRRVIRRTFRQEILNSVQARATPALLYHYTDQKGLLGIINKREIWASHHQCLNDTQEYLHAKGLVHDEIEKRSAASRTESRSLFEAMRSALYGPGNEEVNLYVASFSEDGDSLPQWRAYGGQAAGFALGFSGDRLVLPERFMILQCIYKPEEQCKVVEAIVDEAAQELAQMPVVGPANAAVAAKENLLSILHQFALIFKHEKFQEEREWRIISPVLMDFKPAYPVNEEIRLDFKPGKSMLIPYWRVPLKDTLNDSSPPLHEIVVGPNPNPEQSHQSLRSLLRIQGLITTKVRGSQIPYRNW